jgi:LuxR family transcriptional regulator, maltose regulon positive regulatory protein
VTGALLHDAGNWQVGADATDPVLLSKITSPGLPRWSVARPRIDKLIAAGVRGRLTTVTGPPGAGKTMAIALWVAASSYPCKLAWLTIDSYDNQPGVFWCHVLAALRGAGVAIARDLASLRAAPSDDYELLLRVSATLAGQDPPVVLVLDDLHLLTEPRVLDELSYVLANASPGLRLLASSRIDPPLPLHRYRLVGELTEIRADDLAFSVAESATLLAHHGIELPAASVECLTQATEGWAAGIRLAALSLDGHPDPELFVKELDTEDSAITGYLVDEVLNSQPAAVRDLLLRTSIVDCVSTELASELTGDEQVAARLPALARTNAFIRPLGHGWYRYHSMLASVLRLKLRSECGGQLAGLHHRAALWYQRNGRIAEAVRHAADSRDWLLAAQIVLDEFAVPRLIDPHDSQLLASTFRRMPREPAWTQPQALLVMAAADLALSAGGVPSTVESSLAAAETMLERLPAEDVVTARLAAAVIRLALARYTGDLPAAKAAAACAETWLDRLPEGSHTRHPEVWAHVLCARGAVELWEGRFDDAAATFREGASTAVSPASAQERACSLGYLALAEALRDRLSHAVELGGEASLATDRTGDGLAGTLCPATAVALAAVYVERDETQLARAQLKLAEAALHATPDKLIGAIACLVTAQRMLAERHAPAALELIARARQGWPPPPWLELRLSMLESRAHAAAGDIAAAVACARRAGPQSAADAAVALSNAWLAGGDPQAARRALDGAAGGPGGLTAQAGPAGWLADARVSYELGDPARGRRSLERALRSGRAERLRMPFVLEQSWIRPALRRDPLLASSYRDLLTPNPADPATASGLPGTARQAAPLIVEELSEREREVLGHLSQMLSTVEIAAAMYISVNTVKTHLRSIYRKLSATRRGEAVRRARELNLI